MSMAYPAALQQAAGPATEKVPAAPNLLRCSAALEVCAGSRMPVHLAFPAQFSHTSTNPQAQHGTTEEPVREATPLFAIARLHSGIRSRTAALARETGGGRPEGVRTIRPAGAPQSRTHA